MKRDRPGSQKNVEIAIKDSVCQRQIRCQSAEKLLPNKIEKCTCSERECEKQKQLAKKLIHFYIS